MIRDFLPINRADMEARGWDEVDFVLFCPFTHGYSIV